MLKEKNNTAFQKRNIIKKFSRAVPVKTRIEELESDIGVKDFEGVRRVHIVQAK